MNQSGDSGGTVGLKEYFEKVLAEKDRANEQRFAAQQDALDKAETNRDTAIKKAEDSIEKKSDAVYVKLTDLQKALTEVMLRPETEGRFQAVAKDITEIKKTLDQSSGRETGLNAGWGYLVGAAGLIIAIVSRFF